MSIGNTLTLQDPLLVLELLAVLGSLTLLFKVSLSEMLRWQNVGAATSSRKNLLELFEVGTTISAPKKSLHRSAIRMCPKI